MAEKRMFAKTIIDSDAFLEMPLTTQALYFHLSMRADDDGFINNPKKIQRMIGASEDDLKLLIAKSFIIVFESGVVVIKHWKIHNYIQNDRYHPTAYQDEKAMLQVKDNKAYTLMDTECIQDGYRMEAQIRLDKNRLNEINTHVSSETSKKFVPPTEEEVEAYCRDRGNDISGAEFVDFYASKGWMVGKNKMKDWKASVRTWERNRGFKPKKQAPASKEDPEEAARTEAWQKWFDEEDGNV